MAKGKNQPAAKKIKIETPKGVSAKGKPAPKGKAAGKADGKKKAADAGAKKHRLPLSKRFKTLFEARPKSFLIGQDLPPKRDLTHFVKWPRYIRVQRQRKILLKRLKVPPAIHLFDHTLDKGTVVSLFKFLDKMRPEEDAARKKRRAEGAKLIAKAMEGKKKDSDGKPVPLTALQRRVAYREALKTLARRRPISVRYGLNNVTNLVLKRQARLVVIAHDVTPIELVLWLPALCRRKKIPYCVVRGKSRLGQLVHKKKTCALAVTRVKKELRADFKQLVDAIRPQFLDNVSLLRKWGEPRLGIKHNHREAKRQRRLAKIEAEKKQ